MKKLMFIIILFFISCSPKLEVSHIYQKEQPVAVVNEQIVQKGNVINGAKVIEIGNNFVKFEWEGKVIEKKLEGVSETIIEPGEHYYSAIDNYESDNCEEAIRKA